MLMWLAERGDGATAKEIAFANRLALATTYHILNTLVDQGLLAKDAKRRYVLGGGTATLVQGYMRGGVVSEGMIARLRALATRTQATAYLADWGVREMRVLAAVEGDQPVRIAESGLPVGDAHARANGKVLLAYADPEMRESYFAKHPPRRLTQATTCAYDELDREFARIRRRGYAYDEEEYAGGISCVAAPVLSGGAVIAALGISLPTARFVRGRDTLTETVLEVSRSVAGAGIG
jgi:DNA-binding IclR family transcriptional regulator